MQTILLQLVTIPAADNPTVIAILGFVLWTISINLMIIGWRSVRVFSGASKINAFPADEKHGPDWYRRMLRAHANCVENLPFFGLVFVMALILDITGVSDRVALIVLAARIAQSVLHFISTSALAVTIRFTFYSVQLILILWMVVDMLIRFLSI
ncbi:MAG: MAPEG family protein [Leptospiraceae bacterium]|nr:MAPEG family protein [Leptospiraceae bacterium]MCB1314387.1 MAPEG family protein [Leptospiraceae bacterium]MCB1319755.1 MAPEG family protein [Leptospiraceae bacterium]